MRAGTPSFQAPEQLRGENLTEKCDVYTLGGAITELSGERPVWLKWFEKVHCGWTTYIGTLHNLLPLWSWRRTIVGRYYLVGLTSPSMELICTDGSQCRIQDWNCFSERLIALLLRRSSLFLSFTRTLPIHASPFHCFHYRDVQVSQHARWKCTSSPTMGALHSSQSTASLRNFSMELGTCHKM